MGALTWNGDEIKEKLDGAMACAATCDNDYDFQALQLLTQAIEMQLEAILDLQKRVIAIDGRIDSIADYSA